MIPALVSLLLALCLGATCRRFDVPVPAPSRVLGALLVLSMTLGYLSADRILS